MIIIVAVINVIACVAIAVGCGVINTIIDVVFVVIVNIVGIRTIDVFFLSLSTLASSLHSSTHT
jgi:hypothetical protein